MTVFADSSALVKLYAEEPGSELVRSTSALFVSSVARVEVPAALWRKHRIGLLAAAEVRELVERFESDFYGDAVDPPRFAVIPLTRVLLDQAAGLIAKYQLRAYDSVQLASACAARELPSEWYDTFACFDQELCRAAEAEGFTLLK